MLMKKLLFFVVMNIAMFLLTMQRYGKYYKKTRNGATSF